MNIFTLSIITIVAIALVVYMLIKKMDIKITLLGVGLGLMYLALLMGQKIAFKGFTSTGSATLDPISIIPMQFVSTLSEAGLIILILGGYTAYMNKIGANDVTVNVLTKPLGKVKSPYMLVPVVFLLGNLLSLVIPSASNLAIILLATLYPVLRKAGMTTLTAAGVIATTATIIPTPLGGDNIAVVAELVKSPQFANLTVVDYVFRYHAIVSIPSLLVMAAAHYFWQKRMDKKDIASGLVDTISQTGEIKEVKGGSLYKIVYAILPILPIFILLIAYALDIAGIAAIGVDVGLASFLSFIIAIICELIRTKKAKVVLQDTEEFFNGMGRAISVVALLVSASIFVTGLKSIGLISGLQAIMKSTETVGFVLPLILVVFTAIIVILSGSGTALFYAMVPLMLPLAQAAAINPIAVTIPMGLAGNLLRACSPVAAAVLIIAGTTKQSPLNIVKRTLVPSIIALVFMFVLSMIIYL
ncbi:C4-dicarboxylate transporter DcuC [Clostridium cylindrosporum]|uniref:Putative anaerobic C4-dicarboxylate transporter DcuC n=1 Tax=Clostridium cylindrosporum DSM 605 TaxID=1121307 RepID=A0A0J8D4G1_CLOCY|nr:C4-dicarboxylate transporter DcuC [Clostridium cylindrosporum]KMT21050.1 putative anaerobic C4-dicarboxylate transporter DcuC [Clostridium cylindrosporum DSM 605]